MSKTTTLFYTFFIYVLLINSSCAQNDALETLPSLKGKKILMVYGGWPGHKPDVFTDRVSKWLQKEGAQITISDSLGVYTQEKIMNETDLIIQYWTMGEITKEQLEGLQKAVRNGVGLAGCHGGLGDSFRNNPEYQYMIGGQWVSHPGGIIPNYNVDIYNANDAITRGLENFEMKDTEQYYMHIDPNNKVLATTRFNNENDYWIDGAIVPLCWKRYFDKGRVFYLSIGHNPKDFDTQQAWSLLTRGIQWASGSKYLPKENLVEPAYAKN